MKNYLFLTKFNWLQPLLSLVLLCFFIPAIFQYFTPAPDIYIQQNQTSTIQSQDLFYSSNLIKEKQPGNDLSPKVSMKISIASLNFPTFSNIYQENLLQHGPDLPKLLLFTQATSSDL